MITFNITPTPKPRQTRADKWLKRPCVVRYRAYADELRLQAKQKGYKLEQTLYIKFYIPMPKSWSKKKKDLYQNEPHKQRPDIDNLLKAFMDALAVDDCFVWNVSAIKVWGFIGKIVIAD